MIVYSQFWPTLWGWKRNPRAKRNVNKISLGLLWGSVLAVAITIGIVQFAERTGDKGKDWGWIDVVRIVK